MLVVITFASTTAVRRLRRAGVIIIP